MSDRIISILSIILLVAALAYAWYALPEPPPTIVEKYNSDEKTDTVDKSVITTTKTKKNGEKTVVVEKKDVVKTEQKSEQKETTTTPTTNKPPRFSAMAGIVYDKIGKNPPNDYYIGVGLRTLGSIWLDVSQQIKSKETSLGIRMEF